MHIHAKHIGARRKNKIKEIEVTSLEFEALMKWNYLFILQNKIKKRSGHQFIGEN